MSYKVTVYSTSFSNEDEVDKNKLRNDMAWSLGKSIMARVNMSPWTTHDGSIVYRSSIKFEDMEEPRNSE